ncbi:hypothetical protein Sjap_012333 [Stephania japonica]|uniref:Uncharacterized protein n=1 Tax=Stephania japonica TaxID=461633 RepID=A0AAP0IY90_9MAGN
MIGQAYGRVSRHLLHEEILEPVTSDLLKNLWQYDFQHKKSQPREIQKAVWLALKSPGKA